MQLYGWGTFHLTDWFGTISTLGSAQQSIRRCYLRLARRRLRAPPDRGNARLSSCLVGPKAPCRQPSDCSHRIPASAVGKAADHPGCAAGRSQHPRDRLFPDLSENAAVEGRHMERIERETPHAAPYGGSKKIGVDWLQASPFPHSAPLPPQLRPGVARHPFERGSLIAAPGVTDARPASLSLPPGLTDAPFHSARGGSWPPPPAPSGDFLWTPFQPQYARVTCAPRTQLFTWVCRPARLRSTAVSAPDLPTTSWVGGLCIE